MKSLSTRRRHPLALAAVLLVALAATGGLYAVFTTAGQPAQAASAQSLAIQEGKALFITSCSSCHGLNGEGSTDAPSLVGVGAAAVDFQVATGRMPATIQTQQIPQTKRVFTQAQIDQLAAYVASLGPGPAVPTEADYNPADGSMAEGGELFRTNCASCHNFAGAGGALTEGKYAASLAGADPKHIYEAMLTGPQSMPVFNDETLTPEEKRSIIAFVTNITEEGNPGGHGLGRIGPVSEGIVVWIVGIGALVGAAVWIGARAT
ncbi:MAG: c-type cytochrome [Sporichthyaceae bacterium]|nr:c-type cytochrome [Sporichthyaceae bacterium]